MSDIYKDKETGKWYKATNFLGTTFTDEITDEEEIKLLEDSEKALDEAIEKGYV